MQDLYYWIALRLTFGIGNVLYKNLLRHFHTPEQIFQASFEALAEVEGMTRKAADAIRSFKPSPAIDRELETIEAGGVRLVTFSDPAYPEALKNIYDPPPFLYVKGTLQSDDTNIIAAVGSRNASEYGKKITYTICRDLASQGITIVSGMARGIDSAAHRAALAAGGRTIAVLGSGVDVVYPRENRTLYESIAASGAVVSEYPMGTEPNSYNFPARNRIISGLATGVLVAEASPKSGSLITARLALEQGRDVFAVPGNVFSFKSKGTNSLLRSGAKLVENAGDILEELPFNPEHVEVEVSNPDIEALAPEVQQVYGFLKADPVHIDDLLLKSECSSGRLSAILLDLELNGYIKQLPGKRFVRC